jgi:hypothetical protein
VHFADWLCRGAEIDLAGGSRYLSRSRCEPALIVSSCCNWGRRGSVRDTKEVLAGRTVGFCQAAGSSSLGSDPRRCRALCLWLFGPLCGGVRIRNSKVGLRGAPGMPGPACDTRWCNGNTPGFGPGIPGSNPGRVVERTAGEGAGRYEIGENQGWVEPWSQ